MLDYISLDNNPELAQAVRAMFSRMDDDLVFDDPKISGGMKELFARLKGIPLRGADNKAYFANLVREGIYNLKNTGPAMTFTTLKGFFGK